MSSPTPDSASPAGPLTGWGEVMRQHLPSLVAAAVVLIGGWILARVLRALALRAGRILGRGWAPGAGTDQPPVVEGREPWTVLGATAYWGVLIAAIIVAAQILALESFRAWLDRLTGYLPVLLTGLLILVVGFFLSVLARNLVVITLPGDSARGRLLGRALQAVILMTAVVLGADQIGLEVSFLVVLGAVLAGVLAGGTALAASLGSGPFVQNLIGAHYLRQQFRPGQILRVQGFEGRVVEVTATNLLLDCPEGRVSLPARVLHEAPVVLLPEGGEGD